jgi:hypothetical protein
MEKFIYSNIKRLVFVFVLMVAIGLSTNSFAQQGDGDMPSPEEMVAKQLASLKSRMASYKQDLTPAQEFYVDSILLAHYTGVRNAFTDLHKSGMNNESTYVKSSEMWQEKTRAAMQKFLNEQQYIIYLKSIGKGREYKRGKDGKFYLKSELKEKKE